MNILNKRLFFITFLTIIFSNSNLCAQSETEEISNLIEQKRTFNQENKSSTVYKIQLYNGNEAEAFDLKSKFESIFPEFDINVIYKSPEWKTQVGNFKSRLEADRILILVKQKFAGAIVLEDKI